MAKIVQFLDVNPVPAEFQECMATVAVKKPAELEYQLFTALPEGVAEPPQVRNGANRADLFRISHLAANPADIYLDADIEVLQWFTPNRNGKPYFGAHHNRDGRVDIWAIYGNGCQEFFNDLWAKHDKWLEWLKMGRRVIFSAYIWQYLNKCVSPNDYCLISGGYLKHHNLHTWRGQNLGGLGT